MAELVKKVLVAKDDNHTPHPSIRQGFILTVEHDTFCRHCLYLLCSAAAVCTPAPAHPVFFFFSNFFCLAASPHTRKSTTVAPFSGELDRIGASLALPISAQGLHTAGTPPHLRRRRSLAASSVQRWVSHSSHHLLFRVGVDSGVDGSLTSRDWPPTPLPLCELGQFLQYLGYDK